MKDFIEKIADAMDIENVDSLNPETKFRELEEWSSLAALSVIAMYDEVYDKAITGNAIREANTIEDLFYLTK